MRHGGDGSEEGRRRAAPLLFLPHFFPAGSFVRILVLTVLLVAPVPPGEADAGGGEGVSVTARVRSRSVCMFRSKTAALDLGPLDPASPVDVTASVSVDFRCMGSAPVARFSIADDDGLHESGPDGNRLRHVSAPTEHIPYLLTLAPVSGTVPKNVYRPLTISAAVRGADYQDVLVGDYSDAVVVSIDP